MAEARGPRRWLPALAAVLVIGAAAGVEVHNWGGELATYPAMFVTVRSADDIVEVVRDREAYPAPVRALGSRHSNTKVMQFVSQSRGCGSRCAVWGAFGNPPSRLASMVAQRSSNRHLCLG